MAICSCFSNLHWTVIYVLTDLGRLDPHCSNAQSDLERPSLSYLAQISICLRKEKGIGDVGP